MKSTTIIKNKLKILLEKTVKKKEREEININNRGNLKNTSFSIISQNCNGGIIYHDLGLKFLSPTINLYIKPKDFIKFLKNMDHYIEYDPINVSSKNREFPVMLIDDIEIFCVHYKTFEEARNKWNIRKKRINKNNLFIIMNERDNCSYEDIVEFDKLDYNNKVIFVSKEMPEINSSFYIKGSEDISNSEHGIVSLVKYKSILSGRRFIDDFDYVSFLNKETKYNKEYVERSIRK